jgi:hypothetical protein
MVNAESPGATSSFADFMRQRRPEVARAYVRGDADPLTEVSTTRDPASFFPPRSGYIEGAERVKEVNHRGAQQFGPDGETDLEVLHMDEDGDLCILGRVATRHRLNQRTHQRDASTYHGIVSPRGWLLEARAPTRRPSREPESITDLAPRTARPGGNRR